MNEKEVSESVRKEIDKWKKKTRRKGTFYLYKKKAVTIGYNDHARPGFEYHVIWYEKNTDKTKFGIFKDGMLTRYGVLTLATLSGTSATGLWQGSSGVINDDELAAMIKVSKGELEDFELFEIDEVKDIGI